MDGFDIPLFQVDSFTSQRFKGNPAAVVVLKEWLADDLLQTVALENNLSETAFVCRDGGAADCWRIRWFTPTVEIDLCGHATLAAAYVLHQLIAESGPEMSFLSRSGELRVSFESGTTPRYVMDFPAAKVDACELPVGLAAAIGCDAQTIRGIWQGSKYLLLLDSQAAVAELKPNFQALLEAIDKPLIVTAAGDDCDFVSRFFAPQVGINEDPVTGSAHCVLIPFWSQRLTSQELFARQISSRGGEIWGSCQAPDRVILKGQCVLYMKAGFAV